MQKTNLVIFTLLFNCCYSTTTNCSSYIDKDHCYYDYECVWCNNYCQDKNMTCTTDDSYSWELILIIMVMVFAIICTVMTMFILFWICQGLQEKYLDYKMKNSEVEFV